jgi:hypothetical protein
VSALVLMIPADPGRPCWLATVPDRRGVRGWWERRRRLAELVGGQTLTVTDADAHLRSADTRHGLPRRVNDRATRYLRHGSERAQLYRAAGRDWPPSVRLYGDVLVAGGYPGSSVPADVPARLLDHFGVTLE